MQKVTTPLQRKQQLKLRLHAAKKSLPVSWIPTFMHVYKDYAGHATFLQNVNRGLSLDEAVIEKMEQLASRLFVTDQLIP